MLRRWRSLCTKEDLPNANMEHYMDADVDVDFFLNVGNGKEMERNLIGDGFNQSSNMCICKELYACHELIQ